MPSGLAAYEYDSLGRLTKVVYPNGGSITYNYDAMGNRTSVVEVPVGPAPSCCPPTVASLPKAQHGDFENNAMMVMLSTGELVGWGDNTTGALANGIAAATNAPAQKVLYDPNSPMPPFNATIVDWSFVNANLYVVFSNGWVYSAGKNDYGQLGHGDTTARPYLKRIEYFVLNHVKITKVWAAGSAQTTNGGGCVYFQASDYRMFACGANAAGNLGNAGTPTSNVSTPAACAGIVNTPNHVIDVAIASVNANFSAYMLFSDGKLFVAGYNVQGQLGTGTNSNVTGSFISATKDGGAAVTDFVTISANGGYSGVLAGNAIALDSGDIYWSTGYNAHGELGHNDTTNRNRFGGVQWSAEMAQAQIGGGTYGFGFVMRDDGSLQSWGYNGQINLFKLTTSNPALNPHGAYDYPGPLSKALPAKGNALSTNAQLIALAQSGRLVYAGADNGQTGVPYESSLLPGVTLFHRLFMPRALLDGSELVVDIFVHGSAVNQRIFALTDLGNLFACGKNTDSVCTGGISSDVAPANVQWSKISFQ